MITVIRATPGGHDAYGDPNESTERSHRLSGCAVAPRTSSDPADRGRHGAIVGLTLYCPPSSDIVATDQVEIDGVRYDIEGDVGVWSSPFGGDVGGVEVALKRAVG